MGRNPGIGNNYINDENRNYFNSTETSHTRLKSGIIQPIGRYYKDKIWPKKEITSGISIYPQERTNATKKTIHYGKQKEETQLNREIAEEIGDIQQAEENIRNTRKEQFKHAMKRAKKSTNKNDKL